MYFQHYHKSLSLKNTEKLEELKMIYLINVNRSVQSRIIKINVFKNCCLHLFSKIVVHMNIETETERNQIKSRRLVPPWFYFLGQNATKFAVAGSCKCEDERSCHHPREPVRRLFMIILG